MFESESETIDIDSLVDTNSIIKLTSSQHGVRTMFVEVEVSWLSSSFQQHV